MRPVCLKSVDHTNTNSNLPFAIQLVKAHTYARMTKGRALKLRHQICVFRVVYPIEFIIFLHRVQFIQSTARSDSTQPSTTTDKLGLSRTTQLKDRTSEFHWAIRVLVWEITQKQHVLSGIL